ncbi:MAG: hypothetical protein V9H69_09140 [Anaerolineae bacterium]
MEGVDADPGCVGHRAALDFLNYPAGAWGPEEAAVLVALDSGAWLTPVLPAEI